MRAESQTAGKITPRAITIVRSPAQTVRFLTIRFSIVNAGCTKKASNMAHAIGVRKGSKRAYSSYVISARKAKKNTITIRSRFIQLAGFADGVATVGKCFVLGVLGRTLSQQLPSAGRSGESWRWGRSY